jgi:hypothetical protein
MARACYARHKDHLTGEALARRNANRDRRQREIAAWFAELKTTLACRRCGESHPACLQFHQDERSTSSG